MVALVYIFIAGLAEGVMWHLQFHYIQSGIFKNRRFWDPSLSWKNKWKVSYEHGLEYVHVGEERFYMSSGLLVWLTDGFHLMQFIRTVFLALTMGDLVGSYILGILLIVVFKTGFTIMFNGLKEL